MAILEANASLVILVAIRGNRFQRTSLGLKGSPVQFRPARPNPSNGKQLKSPVA